MSRFLFIRNDDVWTLDGSFKEFLDLMLRQKIPVIYGVIPAKLEEPAAAFLRRAKEKNPELIDIVQHGYAHANYAAQGEKKYEFGPSRSYAQQFEDISRGMRIMHQWFGDLVTPGFTPSYHADDASTIDAIEALDIPLYSARLRVPRKDKKFIELPAHLWVNKINAQGQHKPLVLQRLITDLTDALEAGPVAGMVIYHQYAMADPRDKNVLLALIGFILKQRNEGKIRTVLFSDLLAAAGKER